jgi:hypothetical protein
MLDNKGGRGIKAKYPSKTMRVPEILEKLILKLSVELYNRTDLETLESRLNLQQESDTSKKQLSFILPDTDDLISKAQDILKQKKSAKQSMTKLLQVIYSDDSINL